MGTRFRKEGVKRRGEERLVSGLITLAWRLADQTLPSYILIRVPDSKV